VVLDEPVELSLHNPAWPAIAHTECQRLSDNLAISLDHLEHIGSTAVPGLVAKPIVDLMLGVSSFPV
jgi:GrpB-like predicted nucleotidyltransferase (UPF0157 family)